MARFSKIALGMIIVGVICVVIGLILDTLSYYKNESFGVTTECWYRWDEQECEVSSGGSSASYTFVYEDVCDGDSVTDDAQEDGCDVQSRGQAWLALLIIACILGVVAAAADGGVSQVSFGGISNKFLPIIGGLFVAIAIMVWEIDNPIYDDNDDLEAGSSIYLAGAGALLLFVGAGLEFA